MQIKVNDAGSAATVALVGRLDIPGAEAVAPTLARLAGSKNELIIDMSSVTYIASIGLRQLATAANMIRRRGGRLILLNPTSAIAEVIRVTGLMEYLPIASASPRRDLAE
jgi:anti-sigma B factor antagonist